jgi:hypothetical protein
MRPKWTILTMSTGRQCMIQQRAVPQMLKQIVQRRLSCTIHTAVEYHIGWYLKGELLHDF